MLDLQTWKYHIILGFFTLNIYFQTKRKIVDVFTSGSGTADPSAAHELFSYF